MFVRSIKGEFAPLGIGKQIDRQGTRCSVEYFDAPTSDPIVHKIATDHVEPYTLPEQTRVYHFNPTLGAWEIGRLLHDNGATQYVKFPDGADRHLRVADVFVRWAQPIADPTPFLAGKINETPHFADGRCGLVRSLIAQRAASMGISALASSAIELEGHQIDVVRRVLQDPVQRYLLADEVGLGKTIEAGILIRQCFLDGDDDVAVVVIAPDALVPQWRAELASKFFLGHRLDRSLHVLSLGDAAAVRPLLGKAAMLVIDEAHRLTGHRATADPGLYADIAAAAPTIERVLLLSATPALHNERGFLEMLHLLDPDTYPLDGEAGFRRRIERRQALAEIAAGLTPDNSLFLDHLLDQLAELFADDTLLQEHVVALRAIADTMPPVDSPDLAEALGRVRAHLSEVYRLHRRILRHRRRSVGRITSDRDGVTIVRYTSPETAHLTQAVEDWRFGESVAVSRDKEEQRRRDRVRVFGQMLDRTMQYPCSGSGLVGFLARQPHLIGDGEMFGRITRLLGSTELFETRVTAMVDALRPLLAPKQQFLVFCSDSKTADALKVHLAARLQVPIDRHRPDDQEWLAFTFDQNRPILVCDRRAEEGLNLQGRCKIVVHYDLPLDPNRIEQRLGRVDRYGSGDAVRSIVLCCRDNLIECAWIDYLNQALRVFDRSIASLQYLVDDITRRLTSALFAEGPEALADLTEEGADDGGAIEREIRAIDQQDALDALGAPAGDRREGLRDIDEDWENIERNGAAWIEQTLGFSRVVECVEVGPAPRASLFRYRYSTTNPHTSIPLYSFYSNCHSAIDQSPGVKRAGVVQTVPLTFSRRATLSRHGRNLNTRLLRYGDSFISGMWAITQADDRGRSTAVWRYMPGYQTDVVAEVFFRFDYIVEADTTSACEVLRSDDRLTDASAAANVRRGDMALSPFVQTIWLDRELESVEDGATLARLELAYHPEATEQGGRDFNLNPRRWHQAARLDIPELAHWSDLCREARRRSEDHLRALPSFSNALDLAGRFARDVDFGRLGQLRARAERGEAAADWREWELERALSDALIAGICAPSVRLDAILACFISGDIAATAIIDCRA